MSLALALLLAAPGPVHRYALVVGSNTGEDVRAPALRYADDDAVAMHELLLEAGVESVLLASPDVDTRRLHPNTSPLAPPTLDALRGAFAAQRSSMLRAREAGETVEWLFFFSGHGDVERGEGFLGLERGRLTRAILHDDFLSRVPADRTHVVLDACRAGAVIGSKGPGGLRLPMPTSFAADPAWPSNAGFLLSASSSNESHEWERLQSGIFSYEVRSALRGAADADLDGAVSYAELGAFLETANRSIPNPRFRPDFVALPPRGREGLSVALLSWAAPGVESSVGEHAYVERANGERLLDVHSRARLARLHLPEERPLFMRSQDEQREATLEVSSLAVTMLASASAGPARKGALDRALRQLFDVPFGSTEVETFTREWKPPELSALVVPGPPPAAIVGRHVLGALTLTGVVATAVGFSVAWQLRGGAEQLDQQARATRNAELATANGVGIAGVATALAAGIGWLALTWKYELPVLFVTPTAGGGAVSFSLRW